MKLLPWLVFFVGLGFIASGLRPPSYKTEFDLEKFAHLPVLLNGRIKPLDTVARTTLLTIQDRQTVYLEIAERPSFMQKLKARFGGAKLPQTELDPTEWLLDAIFQPEKANSYRTFKIDNPDLLTLLGKNEENLKIEYPDTARRVLAIFGFIPSRYRRFTYDEIKPYFAELERQAQLAQAVEQPKRNAFQRSVLALFGNLITYQQLQYSFVLPDSKDFIGELREFQAALPKGIEAVKLKKDGQPHDEAMAQLMIDSVNRFETMSRMASLFVAPPAPGAPENEWRKIGQALLDIFKDGELNIAAQCYANMGYAWRTNRPSQFNQALSRYHDYLLASVGSRLNKSNAEVAFNEAEPFYKSMVLFAVIFLIGIASWLRWPDLLGRSAFYLLVAAFLATTAGIATRMWLEGRPPVTNLYSSALFVGWAAVGLCIVLEAIYKNAVGIVVGGVIGFCTLLIAHHLALGGDTLEMMRAVLDSNFWLGTHVVVITLGYASTFLAGFLGIMYIVLGVFTKWLPEQFDRRAAVLAPNAAGVATKAKGETNDQAITRMTYGIVCFATLFSLIGTILGGIWADQSWGRFWGWDPKENGALIIVIWNALILHARWGGMVKARGLACLAVFGNIVTSWSWFGTNMLGIGLHSYGFMDKAFIWLAVFMASQVAIVLLGLMTPLENWRSFRAQPKRPTDAPKAVAKA